MAQPALRVSLIGKTAQACEYVSLVCLAVIATLIFAQILLRDFASMAFAGIEELARSSPVPIIASGGIGELEDVVRVSSLAELGVEGVIVGMALYKSKFTLRDAQEAVAERSAG